MRKKTIKFGLDEVMWTVIYMLPVLAYAIAMHHGTPGDFGSFMSNFGLLTNNVVASTIQDLFGTSGLLPLFSDNGFLLYFTYFVVVFILHLCVDFLLFIPRLAHDWMAKFTCTEN